MPIEIVDMVKKAHELKKRKVLINTKRFSRLAHPDKRELGRFETRCVDVYASQTDSYRVPSASV